MTKKEMLERIIALESRVVMLESRPVYYQYPQIYRQYPQPWQPSPWWGTTTGTPSGCVQTTDDTILTT